MLAARFLSAISGRLARPPPVSRCGSLTSEMAVFLAKDKSQRVR